MKINLIPTGFIQHLIKYYPTTLDEACGDDSCLKVVASRLKLKVKETTLSVEETVEVLMGKSLKLSQRAYNELKDIMEGNKVLMPTYDELQKHIKSLDVGEYENSVCSCFK